MTRRVLAALLALAALAPGAAAAEQRLRPDPDLIVYPHLRTVGELALPGAAQSDAGVGVYPRLTRPEKLAFPSPPAVDSAAAWAAGRAGRVSFAIGDARGIGGLDTGRPYRSASLVKAMLLVARLRQLDGRQLSAAERARLDAMIRVSDNDAATATFRRVRPKGLGALARAVGMRSFSVGAHWGDARVTAGDQARFFLSLERLLPAGRRRFAMDLLEAIVAEQSWGIPEEARPRWRTFFKGGWRPLRGGDVVHQGALLRQGPRRVAVVVLSDRNPDQAYGHETIRGVTSRLLRPPPGTLAPAAEVGALTSLRTLARSRPGPKPLHPN